MTTDLDNATEEHTRKRWKVNEEPITTDQSNQTSQKTREQNKKEKQTERSKQAKQLEKEEKRKQNELERKERAEKNKQVKLMEKENKRKQKQIEQNKIKQGKQKEKEEKQLQKQKENEEKELQKQKKKEEIRLNKQKEKEDKRLEKEKEKKVLAELKSSRKEEKLKKRNESRSTKTLEIKKQKSEQEASLYDQAFGDKVLASVLVTEKELLVACWDELKDATVLCPQLLKYISPFETLLGHLLIDIFQQLKACMKKAYAEPNLRLREETFFVLTLPQRFKDENKNIKESFEKLILKVEDEAKMENDHITEWHIGILWCNIVLRMKAELVKEMRFVIKRQKRILSEPLSKDTPVEGLVKEILEKPVKDIVYMYEEKEKLLSVVGALIIKINKKQYLYKYNERNVAAKAAPSPSKRNDIHLLVGNVLYVLTVCQERLFNMWDQNCKALDYNHFVFLRNNDPSDKGLRYLHPGLLKFFSLMQRYVYFVKGYIDFSSPSAAKIWKSFMAYDVIRHDIKSIFLQNIEIIYNNDIKPEIQNRFGICGDNNEIKDTLFRAVYEVLVDAYLNCIIGEFIRLNSANLCDDDKSALEKQTIRPILKFRNQ